MKNIISNRVQNLTRSEIRIMAIECEKSGGINLSQGICDMPLPPILADAAKDAIQKGENHYTRFDGITELRDAVAYKLLNYNGIQTQPDTDIVITSGSTGAFYCACLALLNPGDEMILFEPYYGYHEYTMLALDIVPVYAKLTPPDWHFDPEAVESLITKRTRGIVINTPSNPSGKIFSQEEINQLAEICIRHDLLIFTDEIYEYIVYDGMQHISPGSLSSIKDRVITISGYSKTFSITGWRIGYSACHESLANPIGCASDLVYVCAPAPLQAGVSKAIITLPDSFYTSLSKQYEHKRNLICSALKEASIMPYIPQGAYYVLADVSAIPGTSSKEKAMYLLEKTGVAVVPGSAFYHDEGGNNLIRLCFAKEDKVLEEACERLQRLKLK
ncbi:pyridoxal phosphate-dependent aminotransferase [Cellulosilyticum sp. I15G10I2]|uniref:pyridoxal phosphate-dependent aminotransferase n=1 Tax=Cellulosilyticum sp. I15G10I2 TaxID=1892843 RepID=UPI000A94F9F6|nr:pyridoxal phosphate-dependent aminotransferase [Cellulosilyticum sp. I15G10I2]